MNSELAKDLVTATNLFAHGVKDAAGEHVAAVIVVFIGPDGGSLVSGVGDIGGPESTARMLIEAAEQIRGDVAEGGLRSMNRKPGEPQ